MYKDHIGHQSPEDLNAPLWRYVDLSRFMTMIHSSALWFPQLEKLEDSYEGVMPQGRFDVIMAALDTLGISQPAYKVKVDAARSAMQAEYARRTRQSIYASCWHLSDFESGSMWKIYSDNAIAIRSTFARLRDSFDADPNFDVWIGVVHYCDFDNPNDFLNPKVGPGLYKRRMYEFEKETRAVVYRNQDGTEPVPGGFNVSVNLDTLIEAVYVGPGQHAWFTQLIKSMLEQFGLPDKHVQRSSMDGKPIYLA